MVHGGKRIPQTARWTWQWSFTTDRGILPSWIVSLAMHGTLLLFVATTLKTCSSSGAASTGEGEFREVGLYLKQSKHVIEPQEFLVQEPMNESLFGNVSENSQQLKVDDAVLDDLLEVPAIENRPLLGAGPAPSSIAPHNVDDVLKSGGTAHPVAALAAGLGETSFFDIKAKGTRFVYVVDRSGSMSNYGAIRVAKAELMGSLESLDGTQQFQIMFYNTIALIMEQRKDKPQLYWASDINRTLARRFIGSVLVDGGTDHMPALRKALRFGPEHIFLLTDADEPQLSAADLDEVKRINGGRSKIHCIEFGKGSEIGVENFLKKLARQSGGKYRYRDVTGFSR